MIHVIFYQHNHCGCWSYTLRRRWGSNSCWQISEQFLTYLAFVLFLRKNTELVRPGVGRIQAASSRKRRHVICSQFSLSSVLLLARCQKKENLEWFCYWKSPTLDYWLLVIYNLRTDSLPRKKYENSILYLITHLLLIPEIQNHFQFSTPKNP